MARRLVPHAVLATLVVWGCWSGHAAATPSEYPSTPYGLTGVPTSVALPDAFGGPSEWGDRVWVGMAGEVHELVARAGGRLARRALTPLPAGVKPTAMATNGYADLFLDAANHRVLVYHADNPRAGLVKTLPVGADPRAMVAGFARGDGSYVLVANADRGDLSLYVARGGLAYGAERRVAVGQRPSAMVLFDIEEGIAVANAASGTVSQFTAPDSFEGFRREPVITVGGAPSALGVADSIEVDLNDDVEDDLLVGDATAGTVTPLLSHDRTPWFRTGTPFTTGRADALVAANLDRDAVPDLAIADRGAGQVLVFHGTVPGRFAPPVVAASGIDPVGLLAGDFGGDFRDDLLIADGQGQVVRMLLTPGDRLLAANTSARNVTAGPGGTLVWSERTGRRRHALVAWRDGEARTIPVRRSSALLVPRFGRRHGRPVVTYVRCRGGSCRPFAWDFRRERRLRAAPCGVADIGVWNALTAYVAARSCPAPRRGVWLRREGRPPLRLAAHGSLGDVRAGHVAFLRGRPELAQRAQLADARGRIATLRGAAFGQDHPRLDGRYVYFAETPTLRLLTTRVPVDRPRCRQTWTRAFSDVVGLAGRGNLGTEVADFAVHRGRVFYVDDAGVFEAEPERVTWTRRRC
jgi:hypothetical protein